MSQTDLSTESYELESERLKSEFKSEVEKSKFTQQQVLFLLATFNVASQIHMEELRKTG